MDQSRVTENPHDASSCRIDTGILA